MSRTHLKAGDRRRQLVSAARRVVGRDSLGATNLRSVAAEAGVALGTVHYIFPSKEELLRAVLEDVIDEQARALQASTVDGDDLESALRRTAMTTWRALIEGDPGIQVAQFELTLWALRAPETAHLARWQYERYLELLTAHLSDVARGAGVDPAVETAELARLFLAGIDGLILQYLALGDSRRSLADLEALVHRTALAAVG